MGLSIAGIAINVFMILIILALLIAGIVYNNDLKQCESNQSPFCYNIQCPCDDQTSGPCFGFASMPGPQPGQFYCSNTYLTAVDSNGNPV